MEQADAGECINENYSFWIPPLAHVKPLDPVAECPHCGSSEHKFWECPDAVYYDDAPEPRAPVEPRAAPPAAARRTTPRTRAFRTQRTSTTSPPTGESDGGEDGEPPGGRAASPVHQQGAAALVPPAGLKLHPSAELVPPMRPAEYRNLLA